MRRPSTPLALAVHGRAMGDGMGHAFRSGGLPQLTHLICELRLKTSGKVRKVLDNEALTRGCPPAVRRKVPKEAGPLVVLRATARASGDPADLGLQRFPKSMSTPLVLHQRLVGAERRATRALWACELVLLRLAVTSGVVSIASIAARSEDNTADLLPSSRPCHHEFQPGIRIV